MSNISEITEIKFYADGVEYVVEVLKDTLGGEHNVEEATVSSIKYKFRGINNKRRAMEKLHELSECK